MTNLALASLAVLIAVPLSACGKSEPSPPAKEFGAELRAQLERVLAAVPPTDAPEQKCPDAEIAKHATGMAVDVVLIHIDRLRELTGKAAAAPGGVPAGDMRRNLSNNLFEGTDLKSRMLGELVQQRPWLLVTQPLSASAASAAIEPGDQKTKFYGGSAAVRISLHEPVTGRALCWTVAHAGSSDRVVVVAGNEDDNVQRDLEANIFSSIGPALATITTVVGVRNPPWI